ncbi:hypothetical protein Desaci_1532 [Desulfosporosinus acidiphilus SJ4]|uniref:Uncharacterized protein n=1 Tax=Desulfosporosinus acidiphilus (strain DSM 22704 / JCM 16185 / SJ4) TaxID=646529 RepID=I4D418_DESAJ|nr:hypothetical protein [Desulfosporosinus acidiphilus]AFM40542.1 hypothetical protein Desaci_1532 [Desulfosporosinus acidiphilus SJ4]
MHHLTLSMGLKGFRGILVLVLTSMVVIFIFKQLFRIASVLAIVAILLLIGLPILNLAFHLIR